MSKYWVRQWFHAGGEKWDDGVQGPFDTEDEAQAHIDAEKAWDERVLGINTQPEQYTYVIEEVSSSDEKEVVDEPS